MSNELWTASCILLAFGLLTAAAGSVLNSLAKNKRPYSALAEARVVDIIAVRRDYTVRSEFRNRQAAVFEFYANGKLIKVTDDADLYPCPYSLHQKVLICYNPEDPKQYAVLRRDRWKTGGAVLNLCGIFMVLAGCALFLAYALRLEP